MFPLAFLTQAVAEEGTTTAGSSTGLTVSTHDLVILVEKTKSFDVLV